MDFTFINKVLNLTLRYGYFTNYYYEIWKFLLKINSYCCTFIYTFFFLFLFIFIYLFNS